MTTELVDKALSSIIEDKDNIFHSVKKNFPFLKEMTDLDVLSQDNMIESFKYFDRYKVFKNFVIWFQKTLKLKNKDIEFVEGFVSKKVCLDNDVEVEVTDDDTFEFLNLSVIISKLNNDLLDIFQDNLPDLEEIEFIKSIIVDSEKLEIRLKLFKEDDKNIEDGCAYTII